MIFNFEIHFILKNDRILSVTWIPLAKYNPQACKMSKTQTSLEIFFAKEKKPSKEKGEEASTSKKKESLRSS